MTLDDAASELTGWVSKLPPDLAKTLVNRAYRGICNARLWSFLVEGAQVFTPALLSDGTVSVTQFSDQVTGDATASAAWLAQVLSTGAPFTSRQFRVSTSGPYYSITAVDVSNPAAIILTISDGPSALGYTGTTSASASYQIVRAYITPPSADFKKWISVYDPASGYPLVINKQQADINRKDPLRSSQGQPFWVANYRTDSSGQPMFELWPTSTFEKAFAVLYEKRGVNLASTESFPGVLTEQLVISKALVEAGMWGLAQQGSMPELRGPDWRFFITKGELTYAEQLKECKKVDENTYIMNLIRRQQSGRPGFFADANYMQSHAPYPGW